MVGWRELERSYLQKVERIDLAHDLLARPSWSHSLQERRGCEYEQKSLCAHSTTKVTQFARVSLIVAIPQGVVAGAKARHSDDSTRLFRDLQSTC